MSRQVFSHLSSWSVNEIQNPSRQTRFGQDFNEFCSTDASFTGRLEDNRISANEGREDLPAGNSNGEIPGSDQAENADGNPNGFYILVRKLRGNRLPRESPPFTSHV